MRRLKTIAIVLGVVIFLLLALFIAVLVFHLHA